MNAEALATARKVVIPDLVEEVAKSDGFVTFHVSDIRVLLDLIADLCPEHGYCENIDCGAQVCIPCGLGEFADCGCDVLHCRSADCEAWCRASQHLDDDSNVPHTFASLR